MTTAITTTEVPPTTTTPKQWKLVATFVAGVALAGGVAVGVHAAQVDSAPTRAPHHSVVAQPAISSDPGCRVHPGLC